MTVQELMDALQAIPVSAREREIYCLHCPDGVTTRGGRHNGTGYDEITSVEGCDRPGASPYLRLRAGDNS